ncbi:efflux RND transporter permease subunit [Proteiniphilum acetatigenes]|uniref:efflux RND transporter permease subunit n=1 Tax=Proteiniphilum acetatigenes TaxID=294710 RepID=UPI000360BF50|nr:efflux RND transporter permease subunit [Proteiniphilum acetatigenes]SFK32288.1 Multidrug efflux pump subunit AcrB [Porphyromonadaceae bacterium KH3CP3RA]
MKLTDFFYKNQTLFWAVLVMVVFGGIFAYSVMPKLEDPAISIKQVVVMTYYPGASAHEVELEVTSVLEDELQALSNVSGISSTSSENMSVINLELELSVPPKEMEQRWDILRRKVQMASMKLPQGAMQPIVIDDVSDIYGMFYYITADGYSYIEMQKYAEMLRRELLKVDGVKRVTFFGTREEVIHISLSREMLARNSIYPTQIMSAISAMSQPVNAGYYYTENEEKLKLAVGGKVESEDDLREMIIKTPSGKQVKLGDIASVTREYGDDPQTNGFWVDGEPAIALLVSMEPEAIVPDVGKRADNRMEELKGELPAGFAYDKVYFQPDRVSDAMDSFLWNIVASVLIVVAIIMLAMGFRSGIILGIGLALTVLGTFPILLAVGGTLQRISLGAFIVAMGMLVDNAVVIMDGILVDRKRGLPPKKALFRTAKDTAMPLLGATLIALVTFLPVGLSPDTIGEYASDLFYVLAISLLVSWILALTQIPVFASKMLPARHSERKRKRKKTNPDGESAMHRFIRRSLNLFMARKLTTFTISMACLLLSVWGFTFIKVKFFPDFDYNQLYVEYTLPPQTSSERVKQDILEITRKLSEYKEIAKIAVSQGQTPGRYSLARAVGSGGDNYGEIILNFDDYRDAYRMFPEIQQCLRDEYPDAYIRVRKYSLSINSSHPVEVMFTGPDPAVLRGLSEQAQEIMKQSPMVDAYSVCDNWQPHVKTIQAQYAEQQAKSAGVGREDMGKALQASTQGLPAGLLYDADKQLVIYLKICDNDGSRVSDLQDIPVWSMLPNIAVDDINFPGLVQGNFSADELMDDMFSTVPLSQAIDGLQVGWEEPLIYRYGGQRAIEVQCDPALDSTPSVAKNDIREQIESIALPSGYAMEWLGEEKMQNTAISNILGYLPLVMIIILVILLLLFNSIRKMILVLFCLPFASIGVVLTLMFTGTPFTFMGIIGTIGLIGMLVKNSIVLIDEITRMTNEGVEPYQAIIESTINRTRPVIMASATTILGMLPLIPDPMYGSLAVVVIGGLTFGTIITLILLPIFYALLFRIRKPQKLELIK